MFKFSYFLEMIPKIFLKLDVTLTLTLISIFFALIIGTLLAVVIYYKVKVLDKLAYVYISIMRGTPIVAQLYFFYFGVAIYSSVVRDMSPMDEQYSVSYKDNNPSGNEGCYSTAF